MLALWITNLLLVPNADYSPWIREEHKERTRERETAEIERAQFRQEVAGLLRSFTLKFPVGGRGAEEEATLQASPDEAGTETQNQDERAEPLDRGMDRAAVAAGLAGLAREEAQTMHRPHTPPLFNMVIYSLESNMTHTQETHNHANAWICARTHNRRCILWHIFVLCMYVCVFDTCSYVSVCVCMFMYVCVQSRRRSCNCFKRK